MTDRYHEDELHRLADDGNPNAAADLEAVANRFCNGMASDGATTPAPEFARYRIVDAHFGLSRMIPSPGQQLKDRRP